jgi:ABC-type Zn2+ transport system substrate-binding protein/surface adhesin
MMMKNPKNILINAFTEMEISLAPYTEAVMVKKSALTLFQGEWVVFVESHHEGEEHEGEEAHGHEDHDDHAKEEEAHENESDHAHKEGEEHDDEGHGEHEEHEEASYAPQVVEIIAYNGDDVAIKGLKVGEEYVSDGVYFVKSMILKSSLGEHGH